MFPIPLAERFHTCVSAFVRRYQSLNSSDTVAANDVVVARPLPRRNRKARVVDLQTDEGEALQTVLSHTIAFPNLLITLRQITADMDTGPMDSFYFVLSCSLCSQTVLDAYKDPPQEGLRDHPGEASCEVPKLFYLNCGHISCSRHFDNESA